MELQLILTENFKLANVKKGDKIVFSFIGYKSQTVSFNSSAINKLVLKKMSNQLKEVVVQVGYGTVKKKDATGAISVVAAKDFNKGVTVNADNLLNGRVAGVNSKCWRWCPWFWINYPN